MQLNKLSIINYKNIEAATLDLSAKLNCFIGHNGEGKTNLLDAVYYLSFCRSAFNPKDSEVMRHDADYFVLEGDYTTDGGDKEQVYCGMKRGTKKHFKRNKKEYKRLSMHIGQVPLIFVSPADATLIDGGSEERRRLMDVVISQYDTPYIEDLNRYNKALQQRNKLLKQEEEPDSTLMELLEMQMAEYGEAIYKKRAAFVEELTPVFQRIYQTICENREQVSLEYVSHCQRGSLLDVIRRDRAKDRIMGYSLHGIHKDDLVMKLGDYPIRREGSQGQNKTYVLALKLAQFDFLRRTSGNNTPLLLLDDIFDKLDSSRVEQIVRLVSGDDYGQIFITDTNRDHLDKILQGSSFSYKIFSVEGGEIKEKEG
ncbi:DNA replication/repair protein RecF [Prevotella veroralis]|uniref:DNA replication and repair protein RecF n=1 Tax=Prevotella veroralis F0319 TaxID=649761 RepID=C9MKZ0_9BACT|nr:DNA replication and repair protein RecF [Prevotella veroralis]EEX19810.1 DNA replication and repair protein RecF [Prevotella veroralis F0319]QUB41633.1 DNA replication and repair protein RecF [Prevotella veroralis]